MRAMLPYGARYANILSRYSKVPPMRSDMVPTEAGASGTLPEVQESLLEQAKTKAKATGSVSIDVMERFFSKTIPDGDCLRWRSQKDSNGYGVFWLNGKDAGAHKVAWFLCTGVSSHGFHISHSCGNRDCVRFEHLLMLERGRPTHGESYSRGITSEYATWSAMIRRCENPRDKRWDNYGGRGITVCGRWRYSYQTFLADMGRRPTPHHSIDRINNNGSYEPANCRWATCLEQGQNTTRVRRFEYDGKTKTLREWSLEVGVEFDTLDRRIRVLDWSVERALTTPTFSHADAGFMGGKARWGLAYLEAKCP